MKDNGNFIAKFGEKFCSEEHVAEFEKKSEEKAESAKKFSCCG